jgi:hypothetical protein
MLAPNADVCQWPSEVETALQRQLIFLTVRSQQQQAYLHELSWLIGVTLHGMGIAFWEDHDNLHPTWMVELSIIIRGS